MHNKQQLIKVEMYVEYLPERMDNPIPLKDLNAGEFRDALGQLVLMLVDQQDEWPAHFRVLMSKADLASAEDEKRARDKVEQVNQDLIDSLNNTDENGLTLN